MDDKQDYIPALKYDALTPFYDVVLGWTLRESLFKPQLVKQANIQDGHQVLDVGCGTATLTILLKQLYPKANVVGLDGDAKVLEIAKAKAKAAGTEITFNQGMAFEIPYEDGRFDRVVCSLVLHHLTTTNKLATLQEIYRVLRPGGQLHIADWGKAQDTLMRLAFLSIQFLDGFDTTADNVNGLLPELLLKAKYVDVKEPTQYKTIYGSLSLYTASKSS